MNYRGLGRLLFLAGLLELAIIVFGCTTHNYSATEKIEYVSKDISKVEVIPEVTDFVESYYSIMKDLNVVHDVPSGIGSDSARALLTPLLRQEAAAIGADAVIVVRVDAVESNMSGYRQYVGNGVALKHIDIHPRVEATQAGFVPETNYEILGRVWARYDGTPINPATPERILSFLQNDAAKLGADAIIDYYLSRQGDDQMLESGLWGSGLAVRFYDSPRKKFQRPVLWTAICPWSVVAKTGNRLVKANLGVFSTTAQYYLENSGYHATYSEISLTPDRLAQGLPENELIDRLYGEDVELILFVDLNNGFENGNSNPKSVKASLYSKSLNRVVWTNEVINLDSSTIPLFDAGRRRGDFNLSMTGAYDLANKLFANLPDVKNLGIKAAQTAPDNKDFGTAVSRTVKQSLDILVDNADEFALYQAIMDNDLKDAEKYLAEGADVNFRHYNDNTFLHTAVARGEKDMVRLLLINGADPTLKNYQNLNPLELAEKLNSPDYDLSGVIDILSGYSRND